VVVIVAARQFQFPNHTGIVTRSACIDRVDPGSSQSRPDLDPARGAVPHHVESFGNSRLASRLRCESFPSTIGDAILVSLSGVRANAWRGKVPGSLDGEMSSIM
jgi:hypothetical protein